MTINDPAELARQKALLATEIGAIGSGGVRYAAAMYFYQANLISADLLEIYRRCRKDDFEDPIDLAAFEGIEGPSVLDILPCNHE